MTLPGSSSQRLEFYRWFPFLLVLVALLPRLSAIDRYITPDELVWVYRSVRFREALLAGRWAETLVSGHPGVTTTWLGALGMSVQLALRPGDQPVYHWITHVAWLAPDNVAAFQHLATFLTAGRLAVVLASSFCVGVVYSLAQRLWGRGAALLGAGLLALDPFVVGLTGLLHVDGITAMLGTVSLLALGLALSPGSLARRARWSAAGGACAALAVLSKSPAVALIPFAGLAFLTFLARPPWREAGWTSHWHSFLASGLAWGVSFGLIAVLLLPALWVAPVEGIKTVAGMAGRHAEEALRPVFFLGRTVLDPGPLFYPLALVFRLSPIVLIGIGVAVMLLVRSGQVLRSPSVLVLWAWLPFFIAVINLGGKKFDRYALPVVPALILLAALAWDRLAGRAGRWLAAVLLGFQLLLLVLALPYPLSAFNPLVGGASMVERVLPVGWGEEVSAAGRWLATQPDAGSSTAAASVAPSFAPFFPGRTLLLDEIQLPHLDYLVLTTGARQLDPAAFQRLATEGRLVHTVRYGGLDQAWVYVRPTSVPMPVLQDLPRSPSFDRRVQVRALNVDTTADRVQAHVRWALLQPAGRYTVQLALRDIWDHRWALLETPLLNAAYFYPEHWAPTETAKVAYRLDLPPGIVPADYVLELSLFDTTSGGRMPLIQADGRFAGVVYTSDPVRVPPAAEPLAPAALEIPVAHGLTWLDGALGLLGSSAPPAEVSGGDLATVTLFWRASGPLPPGVELEFSLADGATALSPLSRLPGEAWRVGEVLQERYSIPIPPLLPPGTYSLQLVPLDSNGRPLPGAPAELGQIHVRKTERLFELPAEIPLPLTVRAGDAIELRGAALPIARVAAGGELDLTLYWQSLHQPDDDYSAFVHLVAPDGTNLAQSDRWPADLPTHTWAPGQVIVDEITIDIPPDAPAGPYRVGVGLYRAASGLRLPLVTLDDQPIPEDRFFLPVTVEVIVP